MNVLREILAISSYRPNDGPLMDLYELTLDKHLSNELAREYFEKERSTGSFHLSYNRLKNKALTGILSIKFGQLTGAQQEWIKLFLFYIQVRILYRLNKRESFKKFAPKIIKRATELGVFDIALTISRFLTLFYSEVEPNTSSFNTFHQKAAALKEKIDQEFRIEHFYTRIVFNLRKNKLRFIQLSELDYFTRIKTTNKDFKFRFYYYVLANIKYDLAKDQSSFVQNTKEALTFFESSRFPLPANVRWSFLINLVPIYLQRKKYSQVEATLNACESLSIKGSFNWQLTMLYKALFGFHSQKLGITLGAWKKAQAYTKKLNNQIIKDRWEIVGAYLIFYYKIGKIKSSDLEKLSTTKKLSNFRLYKFINTLQLIQSDQPQKANLLVLQFLHLLADQKLKKYTHLSLTINDHIKKYFNTYPYRRTKLFLQCLRSIVKGNFHPTGAARHAQVQAQKLMQPIQPIDLNLMEKEIVPYHFLWSDCQLLL